MKEQFSVAEHIDFYRHRRARPGYGARKTYLLTQLWQLENEITHYIIAGAAGNPNVKEQRAAAEGLREKTVEELTSITIVSEHD
jgi:hypothetical protein